MAILPLFTLVEKFLENKERNQIAKTYDYRILQSRYVMIIHWGQNKKNHRTNNKSANS